MRSSGRRKPPTRLAVTPGFRLTTCLVHTAPRYGCVLRNRRGFWLKAVVASVIVLVACGAATVRAKDRGASTPRNRAEALLKGLDKDGAQSALRDCLKKCELVFSSEREAVEIANGARADAISVQETGGTFSTDFRIAATEEIDFEGTNAVLYVTSRLGQLRKVALHASDGTMSAEARNRDIRVVLQTNGWDVIHNGTGLTTSRMRAAGLNQRIRLSGSYFEEMQGDVRIDFSNVQSISVTVTGRRIQKWTVTLHGGSQATLPKLQKNLRMGSVSFRFGHGSTETEKQENAALFTAALMRLCAQVRTVEFPK